MCSTARAPTAHSITGADASHAWVAAHCPGLGWVAFDPTNGKIADIEFVTLGWGREFLDVTPLRGVVLGTASQQLSGGRQRHAGTRTRQRRPRLNRGAAPRGPLSGVDPSFSLALAPAAPRMRLPHAPVAQLDRASGYEPEGREFESLQARRGLQRLTHRVSLFSILA